MSNPQRLLILDDGEDLTGEGKHLLGMVEIAFKHCAREGEMRERIIQMDWVLLLKVGQRRRAGMEGPRRQLRNSARLSNFSGGRSRWPGCFLISILPSERLGVHPSPVLASLCFRPVFSFNRQAVFNLKKHLDLSKQYPFTAGIPLGGINSRLKVNTRFVIKFPLLLLFFLLGCINCGSLCG